MTLALKMADARHDGYDEGCEKGISVGLTTGREEGISIGLERGSYEKALEPARNLITMGLSLEQVAQGTGLPIETVLELVDKR